MLRIYALAKSAGATARRKYFDCKRCGTRNWFSHGRPRLCQNVYCGQEFYNIKDLMNKKEATMVHFYNKGIV